MRIGVIRALFPLLLSMYSSSAIADATADARKAIQAQYDKAAVAEGKRDAIGTMSIFGPGYTFTNIKGKKFNLEALKKQTQIVFFQAKKITASTKIVTLKVTGATATVRVSEHSRLVGEDPATKTDSILVLDSVSDDEWVLKNSVWLQTKSKEISAKSLLNGRPVV